jgi:hypothetical protein
VQLLNLLFGVLTKRVGQLITSVISEHKRYAFQRPYPTAKFVDYGKYRTLLFL